MKNNTKKENQNKRFTVKNKNNEQTKWHQNKRYKWLKLCEKVFHINHQGNENHHNEISPHNCYNSYYQNNKSVGKVVEKGKLYAKLVGI